jgi:uncharacterized protein with PQ loop repeat
MFLFIWLIGDIANMSGAIWADLVPTVILLAIYFCLADFILISQCLYYNHINAKRRKESIVSAIGEEEPLLSHHRRNSDTLGLPGSHHRRRSSAVTDRERERERLGSVSKVVDEDEYEEDANPWLKNVLSVLGVIAVGTAGWAIAYQSSVWQPTPDAGDLPDAVPAALGAKILGYGSAVCYLGARIPQIIKNYKDKSCEGLALLFFLLSLMGNATYGASILFHSLEEDYIMTNLPWLIGSLGTMAEDAIIFVQFKLYAVKDRERAVSV